MANYAKVVSREDKWMPFLDQLKGRDGIKYYPHGIRHSTSGCLFFRVGHLWRLIDIDIVEGSELREEDLSNIIEDAFEVLDEKTRDGSSYRVQPTSRKFVVEIYLGRYMNLI